MTKVNWISVKERLPEKTMSGVLVYCEPSIDGLMFPYIGLVSYSAKHKAFNASDYVDDAPNAFKDVTHWAEPIEPPEVNDESDNAENESPIR